MVEKTRKLQKIKGFFITIPKAWVEIMGLQKGDDINLIFDKDKIIITKKDNKNGGIK